MRIYIVDDEPRQRRGMEQLIRNLYPEASILSFNNGLLAIQNMDKQPADIIFSDIFNNFSCNFHYHHLFFLFFKKCI